jgi:hypothetical protein
MPLSTHTPTDLLYFLPFKKHFRAANTSGAYFLNVDQVYQVRVSVSVSGLSIVMCWCSRYKNTEYDVFCYGLCYYRCLLYNAHYITSH